MTQVKLLILVANLVLIRLALANEIYSKPKLAQAELQEAKQGKATNDYSQQVAELSSIALEQVNSLDFAPNAEHLHQTNSSRALVESEPFAAFNTSLLPVEEPNLTNQTSTHRSGRKLDSNRRRRKRQQQVTGNSFAKLFINLLGELEKVDFKRLIADSLSEGRSPNVVSNSSSNLDEKLVRRSGNRRMNNITTTTMVDKVGINDVGVKSRERVNSSALGGDTGNLLSITRQLVKLARSQMVAGNDYGSMYPSSSSWFSPIMPIMPSMLSAASHMLHDSGDSLTAASLKSDWFWVVVPAMIVIGAGVIVVPLVAAWLVSHMMNQNTFTVSAGRRRRKRSSGLPTDSTGGSSIHQDLFRMLDIHRLLDDAPQLVVEKLSRLHSALDSVGSTIADPAFGSGFTKALNNNLRRSPIGTLEKATNKLV